MALHDTTEDEIVSNLTRAGLFFMECQWVQSQMISLIGLKRFPMARHEYVLDSTSLPRDLVKHRYDYLKRTFGPIKSEFLEEFSSSIDLVYRNDLDLIHYKRDMIAHSFVSHDKAYLLHRPGPELRNSQIAQVMEVVTPSEGAYSEDLYAMRFNQRDYWDRNFGVIIRLDTELFAKLADGLGVPRYVV